MIKQNVYLQPLHRYAYRRDDNPIPKITGLFMITPHKMEPRLCYEVTYKDGFVDYVSLSDVISGAHQVVDTEIL